MFPFVSSRFGLVLLPVLLVGAACAVPSQSLENACAPDAGSCIVCASDEQCEIASNPCLPSATCAHRDDNIAVIAIGCEPSAEYEVPPAERCRCRQGTCMATPGQ